MGNIASSLSNIPQVPTLLYYRLTRDTPITKMFSIGCMDRFHVIVQSSVDGPISIRCGHVESTIDVRGGYGEGYGVLAQGEWIDCSSSTIQVVDWSHHDQVQLYIQIYRKNDFRFPESIQPEFVQHCTIPITSKTKIPIPFTDPIVNSMTIKGVHQETQEPFPIALEFRQRVADELVTPFRVNTIGESAHYSDLFLVHSKIRRPFRDVLFLDYPLEKEIECYAYRVTQEGFIPIEDTCTLFVTFSYIPNQQKESYMREYVDATHNSFKQFLLECSIVQ